MSEKVLVRGFWGPRAESDAELAGRVCAFLGRLGHLRPEGLDGWVLPDDGRLAGDDPAWLAGYVHQLVEQGGEEAAELGVILVVSAVSPLGARFTVTAAAGMTSRVAGLQNRVVVDMTPPPAGDREEWLISAEHALAALAEEWDPDWGDVATHELWGAVRGRLETRKRAPRVGYALYLSSARWRAAKGASFPARYEGLPGGGALLSLISGAGALPSPDQVVALDQALADTGALGLTPVDSPHLQ